MMPILQPYNSSASQAGGRISGLMQQMAGRTKRSASVTLGEVED